LNIASTLPWPEAMARPNATPLWRLSMWTTLIPTAIAAALLATVVNLASEINKIQGARRLPGVELTLQRDVAAARQDSTRIDRQVNQKNVDRGA
jgi:hypothetical protein